MKSVNEHVTGPACTCGCGQLTSVTTAQEPCECGCVCCATEPRSREQEIADLRQLENEARSRLAELNAS